MRSLITTLALSLMTAGAAHAQLAPCPGMKVVQPPSVPDGGSLPMTKPPANPASCVTGIKLEQPGVTLWRCIVDYDDPDKAPADAWTNALLVMPAGKPVQMFKDDAMAGQLQLMRAITADLDGDGQPENVLALWNATGNGMGVTYWTLHVFSPDWRHIHTFDSVEEWGRSSLVAAPAGRKGCDLVITDWNEGKDAKGKGGVYLEARFHKLAAGKIEPASDRASLRRRYTYAFQNQRTDFHEASANEEGDIAKWLSHRSVEKLP